MVNPGGRTHDEEQAWLSRARLEMAHEHHTVAKLPCCGSSIEITDPSVDTYVICPNKSCRKKHVVLSGLNHKIRSQTNEPTKHLVW
jgi:hypothetical protein